MTTALQALRNLHAALERGEHGTQLHRYWTEDATTREYPNLIAPAGGEHDLAAITAASERGAGLLSAQRYEVFEAHDLGDQAIVRLTWTGVVARDVGGLRAGQELVAHIAQFARARDGRLAYLATYDCYEPFGSVGG
jgi:hypothetical protein